MGKTVLKLIRRINDKVSRKKILSKVKKEPKRKNRLKPPPEVTKKKLQPPLEGWKRKKIIKLFEQGLNVVAIARRLEIANSCASRILKKYRETGSLQPGVAGAVSKVYTPEIVKKIIELKRENPNIYAWEIRDRLIEKPPASCISSINRILRLHRSEWKPEVRVVRRRYKKPTALTPEVIAKIMEYKTESPLTVVRKIRERLLAEGICNDDTLPSITTIRRYLRKSNISLRQILNRTRSDATLESDVLSSTEADYEEDMPPSGFRISEIDHEDDTPPSGLEIPSLLRRENLTTNPTALYEVRVLEPNATDAKPENSLVSLNRIRRLHQSEKEPEKGVSRRSYKKPAELTPEVTAKIMEYKTDTSLIAVRKIRERLFNEGVCNDDNLPSITTIRRYLQNLYISLRHISNRTRSDATIESDVLFSAETDYESGMPHSRLRITEISYEDDMPPSECQENLPTDPTALYEIQIPEQSATDSNPEKSESEIDAPFSGHDIPKKNVTPEKRRKIKINPPKRKTTVSKDFVQNKQSESGIDLPCQSDTTLPPKKRKANRVPHTTDVFPFGEQTINVSIFKDFPQLWGSGDLIDYSQKRNSLKRKVPMQCLTGQIPESGDSVDSNANRLYKKSRSGDNSPFRNFNELEVAEPCKVVRLNEINNYSCLNSQNQMNRIVYSSSRINGPNFNESDSGCATSSWSIEQDSAHIEEESIQPNFDCKIDKSSPSWEEKSLEQFISTPTTTDKLKPPPLVNCFEKPPRPMRHRHVKFELPMELLSS
ncbi:uncharacterized protein LOC120329137 [Styela clava]